MSHASQNLRSIPVALTIITLGQLPVSPLGLARLIKIAHHRVGELGWDQSELPPGGTADGFLREVCDLRKQQAL